MCWSNRCSEIYETAVTQKCVLRILTQDLVLFWSDWYSKQSLIFICQNLLNSVEWREKLHSNISSLKEASQQQTLAWSWFNRHMSNWKHDAIWLCTCHKVVSLYLDCPVLLNFVSTQVSVNTVLVIVASGSPLYTSWQIDSIDCKKHGCSLYDVTHRYWQAIVKLSVVAWLSHLGSIWLPAYPKTANEVEHQWSTDLF